MATTTATTTATNLVGSLTGSTTTAAAKKAESLFSTIDSSGRGYLLQADFNTLYAGMAAQQENQHPDNSMLTQTTYPSVQPTVFALTQRSVFIADYVGTMMKAANTFNTMDTDHSGRVTHAEFMTALTGTTPESDLTPNNADALAILKQAQTDAQTALDTYDTAGKGYMTEADIAAVWTADPSKGDAAGAADAFKSLDLNGDGQTNLNELMANNFALKISEQLSTLLDPSAQGAISVAALKTDTRTDLPFSMDQISAWDSNKDGWLSQQDVVSGVLQMAQGLVKTYDKSGKNYFDLADIKAAMAANPSATSTQTADDVLKQWDVNGDGKVTLHEALAMTEFSLKDLTPSAIPTTPTDPATPPSDQIKFAGATLAAATDTAKQIMATFDLTGKGYIELGDIANAFIKNPSLGDVDSAIDRLTAWDVDGDGHVTLDEMVVNQSAHQVTKQIMAILDPQSTGAVGITALDSHNTAALPYDLATLKSWDTSGDGSLSADEINAGILKDAKAIMAQYDAAAKGYFDQADIQSVLDAHPDTNGGLTAKGVVTYWDTNSDGHVQLSDIVSGMSGYIAVNQSAPVTASTIYQDALAKAQATLDTFDTGKKGFITQADVAAAYLANSQLGNPDDAANTIATWDQSNDGEVSLSELTSGIELSGLANQFMAQLDPTNQGYISTTSLDGVTISMPSIPDAARVIAGWDSNQDGQIGQDEIVTGLREQAKSYLARFDTANKGYFTLDDVQAGFAKTPPTDATLTPSGVISQWDANQDSKVDLADILAGIAAGVAVDPTWTTATA